MKKLCHPIATTNAEIRYHSRASIAYRPFCKLSTAVSDHPRTRKYPVKSRAPTPGQYNTYVGTKRKYNSENLHKFCNFNRRNFVYGRIRNRKNCNNSDIAGVRATSSVFVDEFSRSPAGKRTPKYRYRRQNFPQRGSANENYRKLTTRHVSEFFFSARERPY